MNPLPRHQEIYSAQIPALTMLVNLGWEFVPPDEVLAMRGGKTQEVVLKEVFRAELRKRRFVYAGKQHALSEQSIDGIVQEMCSPGLNEGLLKANERIYNHLLYGISVTEFVDGKRVNPTIPLVNWQEVEQNSFLFTEEFVVQRSGGVETRRPDMVCFVNGIPWAVIEAKRPDAQAHKGPTVKAGISQHLRNQRPDEIPQLFAYSQLLLSIASAEARYGTVETAETFWSVWKDDDFTLPEVSRIKNRKLTSEQQERLFVQRNEADRDWYHGLIAGGELAVTEQDKLLVGLLSKSRLLEMVRFYSLFDSKIGRIVARYQQVFGIKRLIERVQRRRPDGGREGGVIWHTTGSGKSFTMVFLSKALILHDELKQCRLVVVTDRVDLEDQLSKTFLSGGELAGKKDKIAAMATSGKGLARQIGKGNQRIIFSLVQKFNTATKLPECYNSDPNIIVLVDEGHRSQEGENHALMKRSLPKAAFVAFTGTPLLKNDKTENKFGKIIHAYTMQQAVEDKAVTKLLYEERIPDLELNERAIDRWFARITEGLTETQKADLKRKYTRKGEVYKSEDRMRLIALDLANHLVKNVHEELKAQLACNSKENAIFYKNELDKIGLFESAVVMSPPDTREGNTSVEEKDAPVVSRWWKENVGTQEEKKYTKAVKDAFARKDGPRLLIVVSKLLTGFDEPRNSVLYIDKSLKQHELLQAIARVNRLHPDKDFGYLISYRGETLKELDTTIGKYQNLASRTQGGYDIKDLEGLYHQMSSEYKQLPHLYDELWAIFTEVENKQDSESMRQVLIPRMEEDEEGAFFDANEKRRDDFGNALREFGRCLKVALQSASFFEDAAFDDKLRRHYKDTLKELTNLWRLVSRDSGESVEYERYANDIRKMMDKHVVGVEIKEPKGRFEVGKMGLKEKPEDWDDQKTRNETDLIKTRITKTIDIELREDPYAKEEFSKLLKATIEEAERLFDNPLKQYWLFKDFEEQVEKRELEEIPNVFAGKPHAQAYYGLFLKCFHEALVSREVDKWTSLAFQVDKMVESAVAENSINPENIENSINTGLLPLLFKQCKTHGLGMEAAKDLVRQIIHIVKLGLDG